MMSSVPSDIPIGRLTLHQGVGQTVRDMKYLYHSEGGLSGSGCGVGVAICVCFAR